MILTMATAVKVDRFQMWIYHSHFNATPEDKLGIPLLSGYIPGAMQQPHHQLRNDWQEGQLDCWFLNPLSPDSIIGYQIGTLHCK